MNAQRWLIVGRALVVLGWGMVATGVLGILLGLSATSAHAVSGADRARIGSTIVPNGSVMPEYSAGSVTFQGTSATGKPEVTRIGHTWDAQPSRQTQLNENYRVKVAGNELDIARRSTIPPAAITRAAGIALKTLAPVAVGIELWDLFKEVRVTPDGQGGLLHDPGQAESSVFGYTATLSASGPAWTCTGESSSKVSAAQIAADCAVEKPQYSTCPVYNGWCYSAVVGAYVSETSNSVTLKRVTNRMWCAPPNGCNINNGSGTGYPTNVDWTIPVSGGEQNAGCPEVFDALDPAWNSPAGAPPGPDGKCPTGRHNHAGITPSAAGDLLEAQKPPDGEALRRMAEDTLARDVPIEGAAPGGIAGPTSVPGAPTTTTHQNPDGTTKTTTKTPTTNYTYSGDTINYTITTVTVINNAGDVTTTTEGTTPEESDACKVAPDSLGCSKMGTPGTDQPAWQTRDVVFAPEDLGFGAGSCPAPESWDVFGITLAWGYEPVCEVAPIIRLALLAFAAIGAIGVIIKETNS
jgi:hypothetical protein